MFACSSLQYPWFCVIGTLKRNSHWHHGNSWYSTIYKVLNIYIYIYIYELIYMNLFISSSSWIQFDFLTMWHLPKGWGKVDAKVTSHPWFSISTWPPLTMLHRPQKFLHPRHEEIQFGTVQVAVSQRSPPAQGWPWKTIVADGFRELLRCETSTVCYSCYHHTFTVNFLLKENDRDDRGIGQHASVYDSWLWVNSRFNSTKGRWL